MKMSDIVLLHKINDIDGESVYTGAYGPHLMMDCHGCNPDKFNRKSITEFIQLLCKAIEMDTEDFHFWDDEDVPEDEKQTEAHAVGTTVGGVFKKKVGIQFIITSSIVIHTLDILERVYIDIFSCKLFNENKATILTREWFETTRIRTHLIQRM